MTKVIEIVVIGDTGSGKSHVLELIDKALRTEYGHHVQIASHDLSLERGLGSPGEKPRVSDTIFNLREQGVPVGNCSAYRSAHSDSQPTGFTVPLDQVELIHKHVEDIGALLYRWDHAGIPAAQIDYDASLLQKAEANAAQLCDELKIGVISNRFIPNARQSEAIRLVAKLINAGAVALIDDEYVPGQLVFRNLKMDKEDCALRDSPASPLPAAESLDAVEGVALSYSLDPLESAISLTVQELGAELSRMSDTRSISTTVYQRLGEHLDALLAEQLKRVTHDE